MASLVANPLSALTMSSARAENDVIETIKALQRPASQHSTAPVSWDAILALCRNRLSPSDFDIVCKLGSIEELVEYGTRLQARYRQTAKAYDLVRLSAFLHQLRAFHGSLDVLAHVHPTGVAPLWGSIRLCIELVEETNDVLQMVVDMFDEINATIPRIETYIQILGEAEALIEPCQEVHLLIAEFACLVIRYFRVNPLKNLLLTTWKPFRVDFDRIITKIRRKTNQIELEVKTLSLRLDVSRHEEVRRMMNTMDLKSRARLPCHFVPHSRYAGFVGREFELQDMASHLQKGAATQLAVSLYGLGGVGKTQIALEYIYDHESEYPAIFWISADTTVKLGQDVRAALIKLGLVQPDGSENDQQCLTMFKDWLCETDEMWLLVIDNADDLKTVQPLWPTSRQGHILLTSRDPGSSRYPNLSKTMKGVKVNPLSDSDGTALLLTILQSGADIPSGASINNEERDIITASALIKELGGLPLAINQIASFILDTQCSLEDCWEMYSDLQSRNALLSQEPINLNVGYEYSLSSVWQLSMSRINAGNSDALHLLQLLAVLDPDGVPESLLSGAGRLHDGAPRPSLVYLERKIQLLNATKALLQQSMITKASTSRELSTHRLVSAITREQMAPADRQQRFDDGLELLYRQFPRLSVEKSSLSDEWPRCRLYIAQVMALEAFYREADPPLEPRSNFCALLSYACWFLFEQGLLGQAMQMLPTGKAVGEATLPASQFALSTIYRALGGISLDVNEPRAALANFTMVLELRRSINEVAIAQGLTNVALADLALGQTATAREKIEEAKGIYSRYPEKAKGYRAIMFDVSGLIEAQSGNVDAGIENVNKAIALYDETQGPGNYWAAFCNYEIGNMYLLADREQDAFEAHTLSLSVRRDKLGETYSTAASLHKVAWLLHRRGDDPGAAELLLNALKIYGEIYQGKGGLARSNYLMSMILAAQGSDEDAASCKAFAALLRQELTGTPPERDDTLAAYDTLVGWQDR